MPAYQTKKTVMVLFQIDGWLVNSDHIQSFAEQAFASMKNLVMVTGPNGEKLTITSVKVVPERLADRTSESLLNSGLL